MTKFRSSYATICAVLVLALTMGAIVSHGPVPPPDGDGDNGGNIISHGPVPPPDGDGDNGGNIISHGPVPPPDGDGDNGGNLRFV
jgi:hypothetical protein